MIDAPFEIPKDLRPLGYRKRYLRTIQIITDPLPSAATNDECAPTKLTTNITASQHSGRNVLLPFEQTLRRDDSSLALNSTATSTIEKSSRKLARAATHNNICTSQQAEEPSLNTINDQEHDINEPIVQSTRQRFQSESILSPVKSIGKLVCRCLYATYW